MFLQTYIENIRGALEDNKEMNHHGKSVVINTVAPIEYVVSEGIGFTIANVVGKRRPFALSMKKFNEMH